MSSSSSSSSDYPSPSSSSSSHKISLRQFSLAEIKKTTNNFDHSNLLWKNWSADIYKGTYHDDNGRTGKTIAIILFHIQKQNLQQFLAGFEEQLHFCSKYRHKHVATAIGYCQEPPDINMTVYEYNSSLANLLCAKVTPTSFQLSWEECIEICIDVARGLDYMHTNVQLPNGNTFFHGDVTTSNILLDGNGIGKISDINIDHFSSRSEPALFLAPEFHSSGVVHQSSDAYAFGVLLVKVLSRKVSLDMEDRYIGISLKKCIMNKTINELLHPEMRAQISPERLNVFLQIAGECLENEWEKRPSFNQLVKMLELSMSSTISSHQRLVHRYSLHEIEDITSNFNSILGQGGEGKVYKGLTPASINVAVKCLKPESSTGFDKEIEMLSDLDHPNLISLIGYCQESNQNILIYELMSNGNLAQSLYSTTNHPLNWMQRLNICIGAARGLRYLHTRTKISHKGIIHRDVKPVNILLDENFNAKISDFGLAKMGPQDQSNSVIATMVKGTRGYFAPEYQRYAKITRKIDVYAFGVVLSEVLCKKKPWDRDESFYPTENEKYSQWAKENTDHDLKGLIAPMCLEGFVGILEKCLNMNPNKRPSMNDVVSELEYALKWQETWQRHKTGKKFCLPGGEDCIVLYYSSTSQQVKRSINLRLLLRRLLVHVDERDTAKDMYAKELKQVVGNTVDIHIPHVFVHGKYLKNVNEVKKFYKAGELAKLCGVVHPEFICNSCGEAKSCGDCKQTEWYIHCGKCDALTKVQQQKEMKLRSCLECGGTQLIYGANIERN